MITSCSRDEDPHALDRKYMHVIGGLLYIDRDCDKRGLTAAMRITLHSLLTGKSFMSPKFAATSRKMLSFHSTLVMLV